MLRSFTCYNKYNQQIGRASRGKRLELGGRRSVKKNTDIFFRGNGDIIGATKIDEKILEEIRKSEALTAIRNEISESESQEVNGVVSERELVEKEETNNSDGINIFADFEEGSE